MKKYNLSNIMKRAWTIFKISARRAAIKFAEALKESWAIEKGIVEGAEKEEAEKANGIVEMHYAEYKKKLRRLQDRRWLLQQSNQDH